MIIFLNGKFLPKKKAKISVFDNGFLYGDGLYETLRTYQGKILDLDVHLKRLEKSAKLIGIRIPWPLKKIAAWTKKIVQLNNFKEARVRITLTRGENGFDFLTCKKPTLCIFGENLRQEPKNVYQRGASAITLKLQRILPEAKTLSLVHMIVANRFKATKKAYETILIDEKNFVREGASTNIFMIKNGIFRTPKNKILMGTTRDLIIKIIKELGLKLSEKDFKINTLTNADEIFLTNRVREIIPVTQLNEKIVGNGKPGPLTKKIMRAFQEHVKNSLSKN